MKKFSNAFKLLFATGAASFLLSCGGEKKEAPVEEAVKTQDTVASMKAAPEPVFTPFDVAIIKHAVKDYDKWRPAFNADSTTRKESGLEDIVVGREIDRTGNIYIAMKTSDVAKAKAFSESPRLKEVMTKAGVSSKPTMEITHVIRFNPDAKEKTWVTVSHKVKDFDAWLKVFDNEGKANREAQGLYDVVLGRGIDDPNMVYLVFDIKDLAKAKASILSEEKKKLMESAGVEGKPVIEFYTTAE